NSVVRETPADKGRAFRHCVGSSYEAVAKQVNAAQGKTNWRARMDFGRSAPYVEDATLGLAPVRRVLRLSVLFRRSNQNGAPSDAASAVRNHPAMNRSHAHPGA